MGYDAAVAASPEAVAAGANLIVTTTPSREPLLLSEWIRPGTHITAVGSDTAEKQELDPQILGRARVFADSLSQSETRGEVYRAVKIGAVQRIDVVELGDVIGGRVSGRKSADDITVADLTGVAVQDLAIATAVLTKSQA